MKKIVFLITIILSFAVCFDVSAKEINHFTSKVDNEVTMGNTYNSSVAAAGDSVNLTGKVNGILAMAGNKVTLDGIVDYGVIAGNVITLNGGINNDGFIAGNLITTGPESHFKRDIVIAGTDVELNGNFDRNVSVYASKVTIKEAAIKGNVKLYTESITVNKGAKIEGVLYYPEDSHYKISDEATVGSIEKTPAIQVEDEENYFATFAAKIWSFLGLALVFAFITLFFPKVFERINDKYKEMTVSEAVEVFTKGVVVFILVPVVAIILCLTMIGIPLGIILLLIYGISLYLTTVFTGYLIGYKIWQKVFNKEAHVLLFGLIGLFILLLLQLIPGLRILVTIISVLVGLGLIFDTLRSK